MKDIMVSILVPTYGHEQYIAQALNSILKQKTQYPYEVIVGEDASPDNTRHILQQYEEEYPGVFTMVYRDANLGSAANGQDLLNRAAGKYIIVLEGDDFWISEDKLQRQLTYLEEHPQYIAVAHNCLVVDEASVQIAEKYPECRDTEYTFRHFRNNILPGQTASILYRTNPYRQIAADEIWEQNPLPGDQIVILGALAKGRIYCIQEKMSAYRHIRRNGTSYSANKEQDFTGKILWWKMAIDFARRQGNKNVEIAAEGRYLAMIFFDGLLKREITFSKAYELYQYVNHKWKVLIIKIYDFIMRKARSIHGKN